ncbi:RimJ/RimL family protein N-acetyltransferase [Palleronia aestuarii]|uniref:RimJ/RimL family protein N-acetyltransferase n=1 Tax=Palleronia aestuarii TaxID=568105 RepID=A0A2W7N6N0_9RHOB|nr:GNAT family N-acetyltransferase [Palleronia aestuarii]PZX15758.1 RimJ/RimL family protein N-acetyltransferase [Palleronia aestuarii]
MSDGRTSAVPPEAGLPTLETERLILRGPRPEDFGPMRDFFASDRSRFVGGPRSELDAWRSFASRWGHIAINGFGVFSVTVKGSDTCIGQIGPIFMPGWAEPEIGWSLFSGEGHGYAFEAAMAARDHAYRDLGWTTAISYIDVENARSQALARRMGCVEDPSVPHPFDKDVCAWRHPAPSEAMS